MSGVLAKPVSGSILQPGHPISRGLDVYWAMTEGGGKVLHNAAGVQYTSSMTGTPTWERCSRFPGPALYFDGVNDYFNFGNVLAVRTHDVSMMVLVRADEPQLDSYSGITYGVIAGRGPLAGAGQGCSLHLVNDQPTFQFRQAATFYTITSSTSILGTGWHVLVGVVDRDSATGQRLYVDGVLRGTKDPTALVAADIYYASDRFVIGSRYAPTAYVYDFRGYIGAVAQWHRVLTDSEIGRLTRDPFCVLRRPTARSVAAMGSGTPTTFKPAWAIRRRQTIGGGIL